MAIIILEEERLREANQSQLKGGLFTLNQFSFIIY